MPLVVSELYRMTYHSPLSPICMSGYLARTPPCPFAPSPCRTSTLVAYAENSSGEYRGSYQQAGGSQSAP